MTSVPSNRVSGKKTRVSSMKTGVFILETQYSNFGHSSGKPGKVMELKSGQGKVRENELLQLFNCRDYCSDRNMQQWSSLLDYVVRQCHSVTQP